jgi:hypothetical protein
MNVGDVLKWDNFKDIKKGGVIKPRWFIYLGYSSVFLTPIFVHICTTTTKISDFQTGGNRANHNYILFDSNTTPFEQDCILDFDEQPYQYEKPIVENHKDITIKGSLDKNLLKQIYNGLLKSNYYSKKILEDIHNSLNMIGIVGLKKP